MKPYRVIRRLAVAIALSLAVVAGVGTISGCATVSAPAPQTLSQRLAVTITAVTAVRQTTLALLQAKKITPEDAENIQTQADTVMTGAKVVQTLAAFDPPAAEAKLVSTRSVLVALQSYLAIREAK